VSKRAILFAGDVPVLAPALPPAVEPVRSRRSVGRLGGRPASAATLEVQAPPLLRDQQFWQHARRPYWRLKRVQDLVLAPLLLVVLAPVFLLAVILVACDVGRPLIFRQKRPGARGAPFQIYKFRTMRAPLDRDGRVRPDDQRVSAIGRFLRASRLDELPQLVNVLKGEMSFIGPRPLLPVDQVPGLEARLAIPPGITGWAQVNGGRGLTAPEKAALDLWYLQEASLRIDARIFLATIATIFRGDITNRAAIAAAWRALAPAVQGHHRALPAPAPLPGLMSSETGGTR